MKKIVFILLLACISNLTACSKDNKNEKNDNLLVGTSWSNKKVDSEGTYRNYIFKFSSLSDCNYIVEHFTNGVKIDEENSPGKYAYENGTVTFTYTNGVDQQSFIGQVVGDVLNVDWGDGEIITYQKVN